jgi:hypothetical protein
MQAGLHAANYARRHACGGEAVAYADVCWRMLTYADVCCSKWRAPACRWRRSSSGGGGARKTLTLTCQKTLAKSLAKQDALTKSVFANCSRRWGSHYTLAKLLEHTACACVFCEVTEREGERVLGGTATICPRVVECVRISLGWCSCQVSVTSLWIHIVLASGVNLAVELSSLGLTLDG